MKNIMFLLFWFLLNLYYPQSRAQVYSDALISISENNEILTDMLYIKFKMANIIEIPSGEVKTDGNSISDNYPGIKNLITNYCNEWNVSLNELELSKAIPQAKEEDTLYIDNITREIKILPNLARVYIVKFPKPVDVEKIISDLKNFPEVEYTHGPVQWVDCAETPNDPKYLDGGQWYLNTIQAPAAWGITKGSADIKIALIEGGGTELTHDDLESKIVGGDGNPGGIQTPHGTSVAGIAGAVTNNETGIASLGWNISLLTYKPYNDDVYRTVLAQKIHDAVDDGADVVNCSFRTIKGGFTECNPPNGEGENELTYYYNWDYDLVLEAVNYALGHNVVVVAAAGNNAGTINLEEPCEPVPYPIYPASYSGVIAVSGSQQDNNFVEEWNYGSHVDINAPGRTDANTGLWSTDVNNSYTNSINKTSGTSFATPLVSALAALIKSLNPSFTPIQIESIMESATDKIDQIQYPDNGNGWNNHLGYGRINAHKALLEALRLIAEENISMNYDATAHNNNHILERGYFGKLHEVFHSGGEIFYRRSSNNGDSWEITKRITTGDGSSNHPSIAAGNSGSQDILCIVWQKKIDSRHYDIMYSKSANMGTTWSTPQIVPGCSNVWISLYQSGDYYGPEPTPVVASFVGNEMGEPASAFLLVYAAENGVHYRYNNAWYLAWIIPAHDIIPGSSGSNSTNWYPSLTTYNSQDSYGGYYRVNLTYDNRWNNVYSQIFNYLNGSASWTSRVQVSSTGDNNRLSSIAVDYLNDRLAVWSGFNISQNNFTIRFRKGFANGTWGPWQKEWSITGVNSLNPAVTYYNRGSGNPYGIDILWYTSADEIMQKRYSGREDSWFSTQLIANSGLFANLTHERQNTTIPRQIWTDQSEQPYTILYNSDYLPKGDLLFGEEIRRAAEIADTSNNSYLSIELSEPIITLINGDQIKMPFKSYNYLDTLELTTDNIFDYLQTELVNIPNNAQSVTFKVNINASQPDTLSDGTLNTDPQTPFRTINFGLLARDSSHILLNNIGNHLLNNLSGIHHYSREFTVNALVLRGRNICVLPNINLSGTFNQNNLYFTLVNVSIEGVNIGKDSPENDNVIPTEFSLEQNYPNPFNPVTTIKYDIVRAQDVKVTVFDILGRVVATLINEQQQPGSYEVKWNASNVSSGVYFYQLRTGNFVDTKKMLLLR